MALAATAVAPPIYYVSCTKNIASPRPICEPSNRATRKSIPTSWPNPTVRLSIILRRLSHSLSIFKTTELYISIRPN